MPGTEPHIFPWSALSGGTLLEAAAMVSGFVGVLFLGSMLLPGRRVTGPDVEGTSSTYKLNGLALFLIVAIAACFAQVSGWFSLSVLHTHFAALFVVTNVFAFALVRLAVLAGRQAPGCITGTVAGVSSLAWNSTPPGSGWT